MNVNCKYQKNPTLSESFRIKFGTIFTEWTDKSSFFNFYHQTPCRNGSATCGNGSAACGNGSAACGNGSAACGNGSAACGNGSAACGNGSAACGNGSVPCKNNFIIILYLCFTIKNVKS
jgi:hypothetical protein